MSEAASSLSLRKRILIGLQILFSPYRRPGLTHPYGPPGQRSTPDIETLLHLLGSVLIPWHIPHPQSLGNRFDLSAHGICAKGRPFFMVQISIDDRALFSCVSRECAAALEGEFSILLEDPRTRFKGKPALKPSACKAFPRQLGAATLTAADFSGHARRKNERRLKTILPFLNSAA